MRDCLSPEEIKERLKDAGINPTAQRIAIARFVLCEADHPTADDVRQWADANFPMVSRATVYNTLNKLVEVGILCEVKLSHVNKVMYDTNTKAHYHFYDEKTGRLIDIDPEDVQIKTKLPKSMKISDVEVVFTGVSE